MVGYGSLEEYENSFAGNNRFITMTQIQTYIRIRPFHKSEYSTESRLQVQETSSIRIKNGNGKRVKKFSFNGVSNKYHSQQQFYDICRIDSLVDKVLEGYNSTVFAYGQTGSGKTYTMQGFQYTNSENPKAIINIKSDNQRLGIIPRAMKHMFQKAVQQKQRTYQISVSFLQIYNERIYDLLDIESKEKLSGLKLRWNKYQQFVVDRLSSERCSTLQDVMVLYAKGVRNKIMCKHKLNMSSSRSHCILIVRVEMSTHEDPNDVMRSKFCFVDLAGSEKQEMTGTQGVHYKEAIEINKSLFTLRQVIMALSEFYSSKKDISKLGQAHIPFRDSKLTSILKQSISGESYCTMIACLNPGDTYIQESLQTLTYAALASEISSVPIKNEDERVKQIRRLEAELSRVKNELCNANEHIKKITSLLEEKMSQKQVPESTKNVESLVKNQVIKQAKTKVKQPQPVPPTDLIQSKEQLMPISPIPLAPRRVIVSKQKELLESMGMIKQLLQSNMTLRQSLSQLKLSLENRDKEFYEVMKENQVLRERWEMVGGFIQEGESQRVEPKGEYYKLEQILNERDTLMHKPYRVNTPSSRHLERRNNSEIISQVQPSKRKSQSVYRRQTLKSLYQRL